MNLEAMATMIADYVEKRARIPMCASEVMQKLTEQEIRFYFRHVFGGIHHGC